MNDYNPLVTIVIPVFNGGDYLKSAIDSALGQEYGNIEVIVVNDGSIDNTDEIARSYGIRIRYFSKENGGVATALNLAIKKASGDYISWLSHDDCYLPKKISRQIEEIKKLENRAMTILFSSGEVYNVIDNKEEYRGNLDLEISTSRQLTKMESLELLFSSQIHGCTLLIPKAAFETVGFFDETLFTTQDYHLWFKFIKAGYSFYYLPETLISTRHHEKQVTFQKWEVAINEQLKLWKFADNLFQVDMQSANKEMQYLVNEKIAVSEFINYLYYSINMDLLQYHCKEFYPVREDSQEIMAVFEKTINWEKGEELISLRKFFLRGPGSYYNSQFYLQGQQLLYTQNELNNTINELNNTRGELNGIINSKSWYITKPLRYFKKILISLKKLRK
jgi:glycosyltransferase involved in cell wall biosynthesis